MDEKTLNEVGAGRGTVYVVTSGSYSDYSINAVFSTREKAERYIDLFCAKNGYDEAGIEEWELDPYEKEMREGIRAYMVHMDEDGNVTSLRLSGAPIGESSFVRLPDNIANYSGNRFYGSIHARDEEHAVKIANERRLMLLAQPGFPE